MMGASIRTDTRNRTKRVGVASGSWSANDGSPTQPPETFHPRFGGGFFSLAAQLISTPEGGRVIGLNDVLLIAKRDEITLAYAKRTSALSAGESDDRPPVLQRQAVAIYDEIFGHGTASNVPTQSLNNIRIQMRRTA